MLSKRQHLTKPIFSIDKKEELQFEPKNCWFAFYTCPRAEKIVYQELIKRNYETFLPMIRTLRFWKNRQKKWIDQVLFPGYVFVYTQQCKLYDVVKTPKVVTYIHCAGKPSVIPTKEIESIKKMLTMGKEITVEDSFYEGEKARIVHGPLSGHEGILVKQKGKKRFGIQLKDINQTVFVEVETNVLEKI